MMLTVLTQNLPNHRSLSAEPSLENRGDTDAGSAVLGVGRDGARRILSSFFKRLSAPYEANSSTSRKAKWQDAPCLP
jgi:hypothetical protein